MDNPKLLTDCAQTLRNMAAALDAEAAKHVVPSCFVVTPQVCADIVTTAFEGGSNYWIDAMEYVDEAVADTLRKESEPVYAYPKFWQIDGRIKLTHDVESGEPETAILSRHGVTRALASPKLSPTVRGRIVAEEYDANDADVVLQIAVLGEVVYG